MNRTRIRLLPLHGVALSSQAKKHTHSEQDWDWVLSELSSGQDAAKLTHALASSRADKPNPLYYAQRTVDMASARLALLADSPIQAVIAMLEARRIAEFPAALCSARAREIAHTAQRMIAGNRRSFQKASGMLAHEQFGLSSEAPTASELKLKLSVTPIQAPKLKSSNL